MADWYFREGPSQSSLVVCPGCRNLVRRGEEFCPFCAKRLGPEKGIRGLIRKARAMPFVVTRILLAIIVAAFLLQMLSDLFLPAGFKSEGKGSLLDLLVSQPYTYILMGSNLHVLVGAFHQYWRLLTHCFLHFGLLHIAFNGYAFWDLGRLAERLWGGRQVFATFILSGITGGAASFAWNMLLDAPKNSAGASGAICGILGLLLGAYYRNKYHVGEYLGSHLVRWAVYILAFGLLMGADNAAHIGGMIGGGVLGYLLPPTNTTASPAQDRKIWTAAAALSLALLLVCVGFAVVFYFQGPEHVNNLFKIMVLR